MPRRSIILQELEQNEKKLNSYNDAVGAYNANAAAQNATYNAQVGEYNAFVESVKAGQQLAVGSNGPGVYTLMKGYSDSDGVPGITAYSADKKGNPQMVGGLVDKLPDAPMGLDGVYLKNPDGTATFHTWDAGYTPPAMGSDDPAYTPYPNDLVFDDMGNRVEPKTDNTAYPNDLIFDDMGNRVIPKTGAATPAGWQKTDYTARLMEFNGTEPVKPPNPEEPDFYTMSRREEAELVNPTATTAEATLAANKGLPAKTELANQQSGGAASVYAERDQEEAIKQSGILARVLSGQIA